MAGGEEVEEEALEEPMLGLRGVEIGADTEAAGEGGGGHVGAGEDVALLHLGGVEKGGEAKGVEDRHDPRVGRHEGAGGHVGAEDGGVVLSDSGGEELVAALVVIIVVTVENGAEEREAVAAGDWSEREVVGVGSSVDFGG